MTKKRWTSCIQRTGKDKKAMNHELYNGSSLFILHLTDWDGKTYLFMDRIIPVEPPSAPTA